MLRKALEMFQPANYLKRRAGLYETQVLADEWITKGVACSPGAQAQEPHI